MARLDAVADQLSDVVDRLAGSRLASLAAILIVALIAFLPGFTSIAPVDGDEPGYAVAARAMLETGDFSTVRLQTENDEWRPRGPYWVQAFVLSFAGPNAPIWVDRLPSLMAAIAAALLTWWLAIALAPPRAALFAGLLVATSWVAGIGARLATADAMLLASTTLTAGALARIWTSPDGRHTGGDAILFWVGLGVGILMKGIVAPAMTAGALLFLSLQRGEFRWLSRLRASTGAVWLFLIVSPWLIAVALTLLQGQGEGPSGEFLVRLGVPFRLEGPPGTYLLMLPLVVGASVAFLLIGLGWLLRDVRRPAVLFALAWSGPLWLVAELLPTKLPQVVLPAIPAIALLTGLAIDAGAARIRGWVSWAFSLVLALVPLAIAFVAPVAFVLIEDRFTLLPTIVFILDAALALVAWWWLRAGKVVASAALAVVVSLILYAGFFGTYFPQLNDYRVGQRLAALAQQTIPCIEKTFAVAGYPEESMVLALGPQTRIVDAWGAADFINTAGCQVAAVDASQITSFRQHAEDLGMKVTDRGRVLGIDLRKMRDVDMHLFTADRTP